MRPRHFIPLLALFAAPAVAQIPINGAGASNGGQSAVARCWLGRADDQPDRIHNRHREAELAGQIRQLRRRIDDLRDSGQISRAEARAMRREVSRAAIFHSAYRGGGISNSEASELQNRIYAAGSMVRPSQPPAR